ncbi:GNAT family N-acetyltransferase [Reinekea sp. G2M2-21]|uniref:GNAT family N-acetyltransferase n=1 Tax=Reinekea sp. G2M2-21 TaxID=2788942 RepID=UPI0018AB7C86
MPCLIRPAELADLPGMVHILNPFISETAITFDTEPYTVDTRRPWFSQFSKTGRHRCVVAEVDGRIVGYANSGPLRPKRAYDTSVEVSIYKARDFHEIGLGSALYDRLFSELAEEDVHRAHALITLPNEASVAIHSKFGFKEVGTLTEAGRKFGQYHSVYWMEKHF